MDKPQKLPRQTPDGRTANIEALRQLLPECFTEVRDNRSGHTRQAIDWDKLRLALADDTADSQDEMYQFNWPGKSDARREAAKPTDETLRPMPEEGESKDWDNTRNVYIEGDNLQVLKLLQQGYMGRVKMIYIDPPYNTGNDFVYHDDFRRTAEEEDLAAGNIDEEGNRFRKNTNTNGRFHSDWCSMIYARLLACRSLLTEDGVIFISIDDNEVANLKKICDEVFGEGNFVAQLVWERAFAPKNDARFISNSHDYILMFSKNINEFVIGRLDRTQEADARYSNPDNDPRGVWQSDNLTVKSYSASCDYPITTPSGRVVEPPAGRCWRLSAKAFAERLADNRIWFGADGTGVPRIKRFLSELKFEGMAPTSILFYKEVGHSQEGAQEVIKLFGDKGVFDGPKPVRLLQRLITLANLKDDSIVLDFFSGSGTTAHSLMAMNADKQKHCKFILVQLPEKISETKKDSGYSTICAIGKERIRRAGAKIRAASPLTTQGLDTGFRVFRLAESNFDNVSLQPKDYEQGQLDLFADNIRPDRTDLDLLFGAMLTMGVPEPLSQPVETVVADGKRIYDVAGGALVACFAEGVTDATVAAIAARRPLRVLFRDSQFQTDAQKINIFEQFKQAMDWTDAEAVKNIKVL